MILGNGFVPYSLTSVSWAAALKNLDVRIRVGVYQGTSEDLSSSSRKTLGVDQAALAARRLELQERKLALQEQQQLQKSKTVPSQDAGTERT